MQTLNSQDYIRAIKADLPREAFLPAPKKLIRMFVYLFLVVMGYLAFRFTSSIFIYVLLSLFIGHTLACIAFLAHELAHGVIIKSRVLRYFLEFLFWGMLLIPATVWRRVHNHTHHAHASTPRDPDRPFFHSEESAATRWYTRVFYPNQRSLHWNPIVAFHLIPYIVRNIAAAFYPPLKTPILVPAKPDYSTRQRLAVISELFGITVFQVCIFILVGHNWLAYLFASPLAYLLTSAVTMAYIFTNHFLNPIHEANDPLLGTTSVIVPPVLDRLHENFSFHTEHHIFPNMNSDFYPLVATALRKRFPERYNSVRLLEAWKRLWRREEFVSDKEK